VVGGLLNAYNGHQGFLSVRHDGTIQKADIQRVEGRIERIEQLLKNSYQRNVVVGTPVVPMSLLIPCGVKHISLIRSVIDNISKQTNLPYESIIALSIPNSTDNIFDMEVSHVQNLKVYVRGGSHSTGNNRQFLIDAASQPILSFMDCDDYMMPQRTEILYRLFNKYPQIEAMIHSYTSDNEVRYNLEVRKRLAEAELSPSSVESWSMPCTFESLWHQPPLEKYKDIPWVPGNGTTEPNHFGDPVWFPHDFVLEPTPKRESHNAWLTIRSETAKSVPYPDLSFGEDSLYNWRLMRLHRNWTFLDMPLGVY